MASTSAAFASTPTSDEARTHCSQSSPVLVWSLCAPGITPQSTGLLSNWAKLGLSREFYDCPKLRGSGAG